jgi:hypothetical protein
MPFLSSSRHILKCAQSLFGWNLGGPVAAAIFLDISNLDANKK